MLPLPEAALHGRRRRRLSWNIISSLSWEACLNRSRTSSNSSCCHDSHPLSWSALPDGAFHRSQFIRRARRYARKNGLTLTSTLAGARAGMDCLPWADFGLRPTRRVARTTLASMLKNLNIDRREFWVMRYAYPCNIVPDEEERGATGREAYNVSFPDVYGANACGWSWEEALEMAEDCLAAALGGYVKCHKTFLPPVPSRKGRSRSQCRPSSQPSWPFTPPCTDRASPRSSWPPGWASTRVPPVELSTQTIVPISARLRGPSKRLAAPW